MTSPRSLRYSVRVSRGRSDCAALQKMQPTLSSLLGEVKYGYLQGVNRISMNFEVRSSNEECRSHRTSFSILHSNFELRNSFARPCRASLDLAQNLVDQLL